MLKKIKQICIEHKWIILVLLAAFIVKSLLTLITRGHSGDIGYFTLWSDAVYENGYQNYYSLNMLTDYPPGYVYVLYVTAWIRYHIFGGIAADSFLGVYLIKFLPIVFELLTGILLYKMASHRFSAGQSAFLAGAYLMNPSDWVISSLWGQVDSVYAFFVIFMCYLCQCKKRKAAYFVFGAGILFKPQTLMFTPIILYSIIKQIFLEDVTFKKFFTDLFAGLAAIGCMVLAVMPFGVGNVIEQYKTTMQSYPFASVNAYNFWALIGQNFEPQTGYLLGIQYQTWGTMVIFAAVILSAVVFFKSKDKEKYYTSMALIISLMFVFSVRMHERYLFPAMVLVFSAYLVSGKKYLIWTYIGFSVGQLINEAHILYLNVRYNRTLSTGPVVNMTAVFLIAILFYYLFKLFQELFPINKK